VGLAHHECDYRKTKDRRQWQTRMSAPPIEDERQICVLNLLRALGR
jgi:hypothetical protein